MSPLRIKMYGLTEIDQSSLKSMLKLAADLLTHQWVIVDSGAAELHIYSFETEQGQVAWQQREPGLTALLTNKGNITEAFDIILKKPLRTSNFSEALNLLEEKIKGYTAKEKNEPVTKTAEKAAIKAPAEPAKADKPSFISNLTKRFTGKKKPAEDLPALTLSVREPTQKSTDTITDPKLLQSWIAQLPDEATQRVSTLLTNLTPLNLTILSFNQRLELLEQYREEINKLLFGWNSLYIKRALFISNEQQRLIRGISHALAELVTGYKLLSEELYNKGHKPASNENYLLVINRASEQLIFQVLHCYQHYRAVPAGTIRQLHQFYFYLEAAQALHSEATVRDTLHSPSFYHHYCQILLVTIADPYSLAKFDVVRLYNVVARFTEQLEIDQLSEKQIKATNSFLMTGQFCIDCDSDYIPLPLVKTAEEVRALPTTRLLNVQPALLAIESILKKPPSTVGELELSLLKKIIPQLNTTYEREYHRLDSAKDRQIHILPGLQAAHQRLKHESTIDSQVWHVDNHGDGGMKASRASEGCFQLNIGDFIAVFEDDLPMKMATVRWLHIDPNGNTEIGLHLIHGEPVAVFCTPDGQAEQHRALLIAAPDKDSSDSIVTDKGLYSPKRALRVKDDGEPYIILASQILASTLDYEQFSYTSKKTDSGS